MSKSSHKHYSGKNAKRVNLYGGDELREQVMRMYVLGLTSPENFEFIMNETSVKNTLTYSQVMEIKNSDMTNSELAEKFGCLIRTVQDIKNKKTKIWYNDK